MLKVAAYTGGENVASARFRVRQYIEPLQSLGVGITEFYPQLTSYPPKTKLLRPFWAIGSLAQRVPSILRSKQFDICLLQREMLSTYVTLEPFIKQPYILDVDDAIWQHRNGKFAQQLARQARLVICGNRFLAEYFSQWNNQVNILPTAVDTERFQPLGIKKDRGEKIIGWSGASGAFQELYRIEKALLQVLNKHRDIKLRVIADRAPCFRTIPNSRIEFIRWTPDTEVQTIQGFSIGIMPLVDSIWNRGKCSYKMLLYMSCGIPVVVSPVGMNADILSLSKCGFGSNEIDEWVEAIDGLLLNPKYAQDLGREGRACVVNHFSITKVAVELARMLETAK